LGKIEIGDKIFYPHIDKTFKNTYNRFVSNKDTILHEREL